MVFPHSSRTHARRHDGLFCVSFLDHLETGFDAGKCSWDWKKRFRDPSAKRDTSAQIRADRGWQPPGARLAGGTTYVLGVEGSWTTGADVATAAPASIMTELGAIVGCLVLDGTLSEPFLITASESWQPAGNGDLYLRCNDAWTSLEDNDGSVTVTLRAMVEPAN